MKNKSLTHLLERLQRAAADLLEIAPLRTDAQTRILANEAGAHLRTIVSPDAVCIELLASDEHVEVFRFAPGRYAAFETGAGT